MSIMKFFEGAAEGHVGLPRAGALAPPAAAEKKPAVPSVLPVPAHVSGPSVECASCKAVQGAGTKCRGRSHGGDGERYEVNSPKRGGKFVFCSKECFYAVLDSGRWPTAAVCPPGGSPSQRTS